MTCTPGTGKPTVLKAGHPELRPGFTSLQCQCSTTLSFSFRTLNGTLGRMNPGPCVKLGEAVEPGSGLKSFHCMTSGEALHFSESLLPQS